MFPILALHINNTILFHQIPLLVIYEMQKSKEDMGAWIEELQQVPKAALIGFFDSGAVTKRT